MDPAYVATHIEEDQCHWWFLGRRAIIRSVLRRSLPRGPLRLAEVGCGSGTLLPVAAEFGDVVGVEALPEFRAVARGRGFSVLPGSLPDQLPLPVDSWDGVFLFDVLEHIDDDRAALQAVARVLRPGGLLVSVVPAYRWLWGPHDQALGHRRRYTARDLTRVAREAGLIPLRATYFNTLLALPIIAVRLFRRWRGAPGHDLSRPVPLLNTLLTRVFSLEAGLLGWTNLPFGVSVLLVARRPAC